MKILGIETSCDETAAAIAEHKNGKIKILSDIVSSQIEIHKKYGGVVPEVAAREHVLNILPVINEALEKAKIKKSEAPKKIDCIAVTIGPGLVTSLIAGIETAKTLSYIWNVPVVGINHIEGHIRANFIGDYGKIKFPALVLTVSGGHTLLALMKKNGKIETIGETRDDAAGEAFDKSAKLMEIGYPGGPIISEYAKRAKKNITKLPRPMLDSPNFDFSFSGLKTALRYALQKDKLWKNKIPEYCAELQQAVIDVLIHKTINASKKYKAKTIMLSGGVSANRELRAQLSSAVKKSDIEFVMPDLAYTTDNAAMIAAAGCFKTHNKKFADWRKLKVDCCLALN
ncbi:MAG: tRNA (adenosine(37)-N6)-threonylcarbamoyltransferase complex transferase subunit TsaD [bacterium]